MFFGLDLLAGGVAAASKYAMKEGSFAKGLVDELATKARNVVGASEHAASFAPFVEKAIKNAPLAARTVGGRMAIGGLSGYALGTGIDWATNDNRWAGRLGLAGTAIGAGLGAKKLGSKFNSAFEYLDQGIKGAHHFTEAAKGRGAASYARARAGAAHLHV